jgi:hypothetical protein
MPSFESGPGRILSSLKKLFADSIPQPLPTKPEASPVFSYENTPAEARLILNRALQIIVNTLKLPDPGFNDRSLELILRNLEEKGYTQIGLYNAGKYHTGGLSRGSKGLPFYLVNRGSAPLNREIDRIEFDDQDEDIILTKASE